MNRFRISIAIIQAVCVGICLNKQAWTNTIFCTAMMFISLIFAGFFKDSK